MPYKEIDSLFPSSVANRGLELSEERKLNTFITDYIDSGFIIIPAFFFRKKGYINFVSKSVRRPSVRPSVCAYVRPSRFL